MSAGPRHPADVPGALAGASRHREATPGAIRHAEVERAVGNVKRTNLDRWMRREWHRAGARGPWSEGRKARWVEWKRHRGAGHWLARPRVTKSKVWVRGRVPPEFLDWVERYWSHDDEARAMLSGWGAGTGSGVPRPRQPAGAPSPAAEPVRRPAQCMPRIRRGPPRPSRAHGESPPIRLRIHSVA